MNLPWRLQLSWRGFFKRLYQAYQDDEVGDNAAAIGYYLIFSLFPFLFFLATLIAYIPFARGSTDTLLERARAFLPSEAMGIVETQHRHRRPLASPPPLGHLRPDRPGRSARPGTRRHLLKRAREGDVEEKKVAVVTNPNAGKNTPRAGLLDAAVRARPDRGSRD